MDNGRPLLGETENVVALVSIRFRLSRRYPPTLITPAGSDIRMGDARTGLLIQPPFQHSESG